MWWDEIQITKLSFTSLMDESKLFDGLQVESL